METLLIQQHPVIMTFGNLYLQKKYNYRNSIKKQNYMIMTFGYLNL